MMLTWHRGVDSNAGMECIALTIWYFTCEYSIVNWSIISIITETNAITQSINIVVIIITIRIYFAPVRYNVVPNTL